MTEHLKHSLEGKNENLDLSAEAKEHAKRIEKETHNATHEQLDKNELKNQVELQAVSGKEVIVDEKETTPNQEFGVHNEMKSQTYERTLGRVRSRLSAPEKAMSKIMHNKAVESLSNGIGKTAARPSGILGAGVIALLGSSILLYMAKYYGFQYNFFVFFILLGGGFVLGILAELLVRAVSKAKR